MTIAQKVLLDDNCSVRLTKLTKWFLVVGLIAFSWFAWSQATSHSVPAPDHRVDINHASIEELSKVPGMTRTWAARIVRFRPYRTKVDLVDKGIVAPEVYDRIKDYVIAHREKVE